LAEHDESQLRLIVSPQAELTTLLARAENCGVQQKPSGEPPRRPRQCQLAHCHGNRPASCEVSGLSIQSIPGEAEGVELARRGRAPKVIAEAVGVCPLTAGKWFKRYKEGGLAGLRDRSSRPRRVRQPTQQPVIARIEALRRQRLTGKAIAAETGVSRGDRMNRTFPGGHLV
jgi:hypothetical protein